MIDKFYYKKYIQDIGEVFSYNLDLNPSDKNILDICVIAREYPDFIREQIRLVKKYLKGPFHYTIFDKSTNLYNSNMILQYCRDNNFTYIKINDIFDQDLALAMKIGLTFNYILYEYVYKRNCKYFGFMEQDIFLTKDINIVDILEDIPCCGRSHNNIYILNLAYPKDEVKQLQYKLWYMWVGFSFFRTVEFTNLDYRARIPGTIEQLDPPYFEQGGYNYDLYFKNIEESSVTEIVHGGENKLIELFKLSEEEITQCKLIYGNTAEYIGVYRIIHGINGNRNQHIINRKNEELVKYLQRY